MQSGHHSGFRLFRPFLLSFFLSISSPQCQRWQLPILVRELDKNTEGNEQASVEALEKLVFGVVAVTFFACLHAINFQPSIALYFSLAAVIVVPLGLRACRAFVNSHRSNRSLRMFAVVYDSLFTRSFIRNTLILATCSCLVNSVFLILLQMFFYVHSFASDRAFSLGIFCEQRILHSAAS